MGLYELDRARAALQVSGAAALLAASPENVRHLTRFPKAGGAVAVLTVDDPQRPTLLVPGGDIDFVLADPDPDVEAVAYGSFYRHFSRDDLSERDATVRRLHEGMRWALSQGEATAEALKRVDGPVIADTPAEAIPGLAEAAPDLDVSVDADLFRRLRMVKTPEEIRRLATAARVAEDAIAASVEHVRPGAAQAELATAYAGAVVAGGAGLGGEHVSIDDGAALGTLNLPDTHVRARSIVRYDVGAVWQGYASAVARCVSLGAPRHRQHAEYEALRRGQQAALDLLRPGLRASQLFAAAVAEVRRGIASYDCIHVGHGIGLAGADDKPRLAPDDDTVIEPGMVLCVETPYYDVGRIGLHVKDMVVVTDDGFEFLTRSSRRLETIG